MTLALGIPPAVARDFSLMIQSCGMTAAAFAIFWRELMTNSGAEPEAWKFLAVCVPIVVFFAPFGSFMSSHFHRQVLAALIYILDTIALITAFVVIPMTINRGILCACLIIGGFIFLLIVSKLAKNYWKEKKPKSKQ